MLKRKQSLSIPCKTKPYTTLVFLHTSFESSHDRSPTRFKLDFQPIRASEKTEEKKKSLRSHEHHNITYDK